MQATFGEKLFYQKKGYTFPPTNCKVCRKAKQTFRGVQGTCNLCHKSYQVSAGKMIMILKNESQFRLPTECPHCRNLSPDERRQMEREKELENDRKRIFAEKMKLYRSPELQAHEKEKLKVQSRRDTEELRRHLKSKVRYQETTKEKELEERRPVHIKEHKGYPILNLYQSLKKDGQVRTDTLFGIPGTKETNSQHPHGHATVDANGKLCYLRETSQDKSIVLFDDLKLQNRSYIMYDNEGNLKDEFKPNKK